MKKYINAHYGGRFHSLEETKKPTTVHELKENELFCSPLWAGGWDEYLVDKSTMRPMTDAEKAVEYSPVVNGWLRGMFSNNQIPDDQCVKVLRHFAGGD